MGETATSSEEEKDTKEEENIQKGFVSVWNYINEIFMSLLGLKPIVEYKYENDSYYPC